MFFYDQSKIVQKIGISSFVPTFGMPSLDETLLG